MLILDASVAISAVIEEASSPVAHDILQRVAQHGAIVPNVWHLEVGQTLLIAERRKKIDAARREEACRSFLDLPVTVDAETFGRAWTDTMALAVKWRLTVYDAAYLELCVRRSLPLATFDKALRRAAAEAGVALV